MKAFPGPSGKHRMEGWGVFRKDVRDDQPWGREEPEAPGAVQGLSQGGGLERGQWSGGTEGEAQPGRILG